MKPLKKIAFTTPEITGCEPQMIAAVLDAGWDMVHIRHPEASLTEIKSIIEALPQKYHSRLRLHGHFVLAAEFNLGGLHLNSRCPQPPAFYNGPLSRSCHTVAEVLDSKGFDYVTLSPVFPSVSKPGYGSTPVFTTQDFSQIDKLAPTVVIALGGVTPATLPLLADLPFGGFAVLGSLMGCGDMSLLKERLCQFNLTLNS